MMMEEFEDVKAGRAGDVPIGTDFLEDGRNDELAVLHEHLGIRVQVGFALRAKDLFRFLDRVDLGELGGGQTTEETVGTDGLAVLAFGDADAHMRHDVLGDAEEGDVVQIGLDDLHEPSRIIVVGVGQADDVRTVGQEMEMRTVGPVEIIGGTAREDGRLAHVLIVLSPRVEELDARRIPEGFGHVTTPLEEKLVSLFGPADILGQFLGRGEEDVLPRPAFVRSVRAFALAELVECGFPLFNLRGPAGSVVHEAGRTRRVPTVMTDRADAVGAEAGGNLGDIPAGGLGFPVSRGGPAEGFFHPQSTGASVLIPAIITGSRMNSKRGILAL